MNSHYFFMKLSISHEIRTNYRRAYAQLHVLKSTLQHNDSSISAPSLQVTFEDVNLLCPLTKATSQHDTSVKSPSIHIQFNLRQLSSSFPNTANTNHNVIVLITSITNNPHFLSFASHYFLLSCKTDKYLIPNITNM